jgi:hypothetical protein
MPEWAIGDDNVLKAFATYTRMSADKRYAKEKELIATIVEKIRSGDIALPLKVSAEPAKINARLLG